MTSDPRLSPRAKQAFVEAEDFRGQIVIPCIVFFELLYLAEKKRIPPDLSTIIEMVGSSRNYRVEPLCLPVIRRARDVPRDKVPDSWDRIIAATSLHLGLPLITRDRALSPHISPGFRIFV
jgi:PIN domain nuclease of toxin-antitoxin system